MAQLYTVNYELPDTVLGDSWVGLTIGAVVVGGITQGTLSRISMWFSKQGTIFRLDSSSSVLRDGAIVLDNTTTWTGHISPISNFLPRPGIWNWDMRFYHSGNVSPITCYAGTINVVPTTNP